MGCLPNPGIAPVPPIASPRRSPRPGGNRRGSGLWRPIRRRRFRSSTVGFAVRHPLIYRKRIDKVEDARPGDLVAVYGPGEQLLGYGLYNPRSEIAVRMLFAGPSCPTTPAGRPDWRKRSGSAAKCFAWTKRPTPTG